ncbi:putative holin-like toxin [Metabacillus sediminilitoris]
MKGGGAYDDILQTLMLMIAFASLVLSIISFKDKK